jgi:Cyclin, N-terminal domain
MMCYIGICHFSHSCKCSLFLFLSFIYIVTCFQQCVCGVYRAHILQAEMDRYKTPPMYSVFNDVQEAGSPSSSFDEPEIPSHDEISNFYRSIFTRAQMEADCIIMSLIYVERLMKSTNGQIRPSAANWRSILFSCMVLSSKVWDDLSMWNADFGQTCPRGVRFTLQRTNELEVAILSALGYMVKVYASEYAKYYFLLRSMLIKSGLGGDDLRSMDPLDVEGAKRLQHMSSQFQSLKAPRKGARLSSRSKSAGTVEPDSNKLQYDFKQKVSLEHVVQM